MSILNQHSDLQDVPLRPVRFFSPDVELTRTGNGLLFRSVEPLGESDRRVGDWLDRWAVEAPDRTFLVEQMPGGERSITYAEARESALLLAEGLLDYGLGPERPLEPGSGSSFADPWWRRTAEHRAR